MNTNEELCFYEPGACNAIDTAKADGRSSCYNNTLDEIRRRYPLAQLIPWSDALRQIDVARAERYQIGVPEETTEEQYNYALEVLPPCRWSNGSFYVSELVHGDIADWYVFLRYHGKPRYYHMYNFTNADKQTMLEMCRGLAEEREGSNHARP